MKLADIERLIDSGESDTVEFKKSTGQLRRAFQTLCAFLNGHGGQVIIGVTSKGKITGQQISDSTLEDVASHIAKLEPPASVMIHRIPLEGSEEKDLLVLGADPGDATVPFAYDGRPYQRLGNTTVVMPQERYQALLIERTHS